MLMLASACGHRGGDPAQAPLAGAAIGGPFTLTDQNGHTVRDTDFAGKYRLIYFGYTYCPDACPTMLQTVGQALRLFEKDDPARAQRLQPIFITVDPERDTPQVLKAYVSNFHPRLIGLTGSPDALAKVEKEYAVYSRKHQVPNTSGYLMDHSTQATLFGPAGEPIALVTPDQSAADMETTFKQWVR